MRISVGAELRFERGDRIGMPLQRNAESGGRSLPGVIVRCRANAAEAEDDVAARKCPRSTATSSARSSPS